LTREELRLELLKDTRAMCQEIFLTTGEIKVPDLENLEVYVDYILEGIYL
jgi:hypothetical protein